MADRSDNFTRADSASSIGSPSDGGGAYTLGSTGATAPTFGISSNQGYLVSAGSGECTLVLDAGVSNATTSVKFSGLGGLTQIIGLAARWVDEDNCTIGYYRPDLGFAIGYLQSGSRSAITSWSGAATLSGGETWELRRIASGNSVGGGDYWQLWVGGTLRQTTDAIASPSYSGYSTATRGGIFLDAAVPSVRFDDFFLDDPAASGAPTLTSPTATVAGDTTATVGATVPIATGNLRAVITSSITTPSTAQVIAGQDHTGSTSGVLSGSLAISSTGAKTFNISGLTSGTTRHVYLALEDAGGNSAVVYAGAIYPGTWRVASDVTVTGWVVTGAATHAAALNEDTADDGAFTTSPALSGTPSSITMALDEPRPAGTYTERFRVNVSSGTGNCRVVALNDAGTVQGQTADQAITSTLTTYTLPLTQSGTATRLRVDVWI
jgi:hypothetical protein